MEVARRLRATLREIDLVARLGGDEFVALLPMLRELRERVMQNGAGMGSITRTCGLQLV